MADLDRVVDQLRKFPHIRYTRSGSTITVAAANADGFPVSISVDAALYRVTLGGWHDEFVDEQQALDHFAMGLFDNVRLKSLARGDGEYRWTIERKQGDRWVRVEECGLLFFPFWKRKRVMYRQNRFIRGAKG